MREIKKLFTDIGPYISACFWKAVELRERRRAMLTLIGALLALPVALVFGGSSSGAQITIFVTSWALIQMFIIAPFEMWRDRRREGLVLDEIGRTDRRFYEPLEISLTKTTADLFIAITNCDTKTIDEVGVKIVSYEFTGHTHAMQCSLGRSQAPGPQFFQGLLVTSSQP